MRMQMVAKIINEIAKICTTEPKFNKKAVIFNQMYIIYHLEIKK